MENCRNKQFASFKLNAILSSGMKSLPCSILTWKRIFPLSSISMLQTLLVSQQPSWLPDRLSQYLCACVQVTLIFLTIVPKHKRSNVCNLDMPERSRLVLPLSKKACIQRKKYSINRVRYYPKFQASTGGLEMFTHWIIRGDNYTLFIN